MKKDFKIEWSRLLKKGNQSFKVFLGYITDMLNKGQTILLKALRIIRNIFLFWIAFFAEIINFPFKLFVNSKKILLEIWTNIKRPFYNTLGTFVAIFFVFLLVFSVIILMKHIYPNFINILSSKFIITSNNYDVQTSQTLNTLISKGKIISASDIYNNMLDYYNTLITILIALMGVFGIVSWISIQGKIKHESELSVDNKFENKDFQCRLEKEVENAAKGILSESEYVSRLAEDNVDLIVSRLLCSKDFVNKMKEIIQNFKDDKNIKFEQLEGVENGDEI